VISSLKSQIGHTLGASGINSLSRGVSAAQAGVYPPTLNFYETDPDIDLEAARLLVAKEPLDWKAPPDGPRRFQVNSFGFGGFNYVVQLEASTADSDTVLVTPRRAEAAETGWRRPSARAEAPRHAQAQLGGGAHAEPTAFLYPGQGSQRRGMGVEPYERYADVRRWLDRFATLTDFDLLGFLFHADDDALRETSKLQPALFSFEFALTQQLLGAGLRPSAAAGHSLGELTALCVAGVFSPEDGIRLVTKRAQLAEAVARQGGKGAMLAARAAREDLASLLEKRPGIVIANINSPRQVVLAGAREDIEALAEEMRCGSTLLKVSMAFHTGAMADARDEFRAFLRSVPLRRPTIPVISNVTGKEYPHDPDAIAELVSRQLDSPVEWLEGMLTLRRDLGIRRFVEVGPGEALAGLVQDSLPDAACTLTCPALKKTFVPIEPALEGVALSPFPRGSDETPVPSVQAASPADLLSPDAVLEEVIRIVMDATGYEKAEIGADMDLRESLAIRSSRFPVILDAAEKRFGITLRFQDLMEVRTVRDAATRIFEIMRRGDQPLATGRSEALQRLALSTAQPKEYPLKRSVFEDRPLDMGAFAPVTFSRGGKVALMTLGSTPLSRKVAKIMVEDYALAPFRLNLSDLAGQGLRAPAVDSGRGPDRRTLEGLLVFLGRLDRRLKTAEDVAGLLRSLFLALKEVLVQARDCKFVFVIQEDRDAGDYLQVFAQAVEGLLLSAALEHPSVQFRCLTLDGRTDLGYAIRCALDRSRTQIENKYRNGEAFSSSGIVSQLVYTGRAPLALLPEDIVVLSGGARGVTAHLARAFRPFGCRLALLGRTPGPDSVNSEGETTPVEASREIQNLIEELRKQGDEVTYHECDVTDRGQVESALRRIALQGTIVGIVHGAAVLRDRLITNTSAEDLAAVVDVKLVGASNLLEAAAPFSKLRFFVALSSIASVTGNLGQAAYSSANRALNALVEVMSRRRPETLWKTLILPPIEGAGSAADAATRQLLKQRGIDRAYITLSELRELFLRDLLLDEDRRRAVAFTRSLPEIGVAALDQTGPAPDPECLDAPTIRARRDEFPMVDSVEVLDLDQRRIQTVRTLSTERDLWLEDHKPFSSSQAPLLSGVMTIEAFLEASVLLFPYLRPLGVRDVRFMDAVECPPGSSRLCRVSCGFLKHEGRRVIVEAALTAPRGDEAPAGPPCARAQVILGSGLPDRLPELPADRQSPAQKEFVFADGSQMRAHYHEMTGFGERYQVLHGLESSENGVSSGVFVENQRQDFSDSRVSKYAYSPYLLEAIMHSAGFSPASQAQRRGQPLRIVPTEISEVVFLRKAYPGEVVSVRTILRRQVEGQSVFSSYASDREGVDIMRVNGLCMVVTRSDAE
jgi:malonyl CoA-acyl carrier protein transacylase/NAD(P)-dependent dehydrogenase (short-subunit alcohol dehydrogenase family)